MAINAAPSNQLDSASNDINAASTIARNMAAKSIGENTSVNEASPNSWLIITNNGASTSAICNGLLLTHLATKKNNYLTRKKEAPLFHFPEVAD